MKLALLFAGQGAQHAGMGADLYEQFPAFRQVMDECAAGVDFDLKSLCFFGPDETLNQTRYTQPCMVAFAAGVTQVLPGGRRTAGGGRGPEPRRILRPVCRRGVHGPSGGGTRGVPRRGDGAGGAGSRQRHGRGAGA